jgi:hypothetical protein
MVYAFPNPFSLSRGMIKFIGMPAGSNLSLYTLSGERVRSFLAQGGINYWDGKNSDGKKVSPGIYLYVLKRSDNNTMTAGKLFITR